jgi:transposase-like protein
MDTTPTEQLEVMANRTIRTPEKRSQFLEVLAQGGSVAAACRGADISRDTAYLWRKDDSDFRADWEYAYEDGTDLFEDALRQLAAQRHVVAIIFALKARRPHIYNRRSEDKDDIIAQALSTDGGKRGRRVIIPATVPEPDERDDGPIIEGEAA